MSGVNIQLADLPAPSEDEQGRSKGLSICLRELIATKGPLPFREFMRAALYDPQYGYYTAGSPVFGADGDFVTAPELSPLFAYSLAKQYVEVSTEMPQAEILEIGAGSGRMAVDILRYLARHDCLPECYNIYELSPVLRERQRQLLVEQIPALLPKIRWLESLQGLCMRGVIFANEVLDAMPVDIFCKRTDGIDARHVLWNDARTDTGGVFEWLDIPANEDLQAAVREIESDLGAPLPEGYCSEVNLNIAPWFKTLSDCLIQGVMLAIDYGYSRKLYYSVERTMGTLMCHYRHYVHDDPLRWPGTQDITAHVDFTAAAIAATEAGFEVKGYSDQAGFLLACGINDLMIECAPAMDEVAKFGMAQELKNLLLPSGMGERFKVLAITKRYDRPLPGICDSNDRRHLL
jgi:SAM-dependent MidA family methyltransferase